MLCHTLLLLGVLAAGSAQVTQNQPEWEAWTSWQPCSTSCASGVQLRTRTCLRKSGCEGEATESRICHGTHHTCSTFQNQPEWEAWTSWQPCSSTRAPGFQLRTRTCLGGSGCEGETTESRICHVLNPVLSAIQKQPEWGAWTSWQPCSTTCASGVQLRTRTCLGGSGCKGEATESRICHTPFPMHSATQKQPEWEAWSPWQPCSTSCASGVQLRTRTCSEEGGCEGKATESRLCHVAHPMCSAIQKQPEWEAWSNWQPCSATCLSGVQLRTRTCSERNGCEGKATESRICHVTHPMCSAIQKQPEWEAWSDWQPCSATCLSGVQLRTRTCREGNGCEGKATESRICHVTHPMCSVASPGNVSFKKFELQSRGDKAHPEALNITENNSGEPNIMYKSLGSSVMENQIGSTFKLDTVVAWNSDYMW